MTISVLRHLGKLFFAEGLAFALYRIKCLAKMLTVQKDRFTGFKYHSQES